MPHNQDNWNFERKQSDSDGFKVSVIVSGDTATSGKIIIETETIQNEIPAVIFSKEKADRIFSLLVETEN